MQMSQVCGVLRWKQRTLMISLVKTGSWVERLCSFATNLCCAPKGWMRSTKQSQISSQWQWHCTPMKKVYTYHAFLTPPPTKSICHSNFHPTCSGVSCSMLNSCWCLNFPFDHPRMCPCMCGAQTFNWLKCIQAYKSLDVQQIFFSCLRRKCFFFNEMHALSAIRLNAGLWPALTPKDSPEIVRCIEIKSYSLLILIDRMTDPGASFTVCMRWNCVRLFVIFRKGRFGAFLRRRTGWTCW